MIVKRLLPAFMAIVIFAATLLGSDVQAYEYRIQPGDRLRIEVVEDETLNREVLVAPDGQISVPLAGVIRVGGETISQAQQKVTSALTGDFAGTPTVTVSLVALKDPNQQTEPFNIFVIGEVKKPGLIQVPPSTTLLQALSMAGGPNDFAAIKRIQLRRKLAGSSTEQVYTFNYKTILQGGSNIGASPVMEGDTIVVPTRRLFE